MLCLSLLYVFEESMNIVIVCIIMVVLRSKKTLCVYQIDTSLSLSFSLSFYLSLSDLSPPSLALSPPSPPSLSLSLSLSLRVSSPANMHQRMLQFMRPDGMPTDSPSQAQQSLHNKYRGMYHS